MYIFEILQVQLYLKRTSCGQMLPVYTEEHTVVHRPERVVKEKFIVLQTVTVFNEH